MVGEVPARGLMDGFRSASGWPYGLRPVPFAPGFSEAASDSFDSIKPGLGRELLMLPRGSSWSSGLILVERAPQPRWWVFVWVSRSVNGFPMGSLTSIGPINGQVCLAFS